MANKAGMVFSDSFFRHNYPPLLFRFPKIIRLVHAWNNLLLQRNRAVNRQLKRLLPQLPPGTVVADAGCGDGQYMFPFLQKHPHLHFWGFDKNNNNIAFCEKYSGVANSGERLKFFHQHLEELALDQAVDLIACVGTLQYIADDTRVLENFYRALKPGRNLLLYIPVNGRCVLPFYPYFFEKLGHYEKSQQRKRVYSPDEITMKLKAAGFNIGKQQPTYGTLGIAAHETYNLLLMGLGNAAWWWSWMFLPLLIFAMPLIVIVNWIDFILPKKQGNGLLILSAKPN